MTESSILGKEWISKNYNSETVKFIKENFNLSEIVSKLIAIRVETYTIQIKLFL